MVARVVRPGEHLDVIAYRHGVTSAEIWNAKANQALRESRAGGHMLMPGDVVELPEKRHPSPVDLTIGASTTIVATIPKVPVELILSGDGKPIASERWHIEALGEEAKGATGSDGKVAFKVRVTTPRVTICLEKLQQRLTVAVGGLDPTDALSGVVHRLNNLGFDAGPETSTMNPRIAEALRKFQIANALAPSALPDGETILALQKVHGS